MATFDPLDPINQLGRSAKAFLDDPFNAPAPGTDPGQRVRQTATQSGHALTLHAAVGTKRGVIGGVQKVSWSQQQDIEEVFEVNSLADGLPVDMVPQLLRTRTLTLDRYELYASTIEQVFGMGGLMLIDALTPISMRFTWKKPEASTFTSFVSGGNLEVYEFSGCRMPSLGKNVSSSGNIIVQSNATLTWKRIQRIL